MKILEAFNLKGLKLENRVVMPPMCMYSSDESGEVKEFHKVHYISRAIGQVGFIIVEATGVVPNGRITSNDLGIWDDKHIEGLKELVDGIKKYGTKTAIQLGHAGRKCESNDEYIVAPSPIRHSEKYREPKVLSTDDIKGLVNSFKDAAIRADKAGFDAVEIHAAHGYLIHSFLSGLTNKRTDEYGGSVVNRTRFLKEILMAIKEVFPSHKPILVRVSADDYLDGGINLDEMVEIINEIKEYIDMVHVSTGGLMSAKIRVFPGYQVRHCEEIRKQCKVPTIAVGLIDQFDQIEELISHERADLVAVGRGLLRDPNFMLNLAHQNNLKIEYPEQYYRGYI